MSPCTTSKIQPCDAGVISALKTKYRTFQLERALGLIDENVKDIYNQDILAAMMKFKNIWNAMDAAVIKNCWRHANVLPDRFNTSHRATDADLNRILDEEAL